MDEWVYILSSGPGSSGSAATLAIIAGLDPAIHHPDEEMDARVKPGHDGGVGASMIQTVASPH